MNKETHKLSVDELAIQFANSRSLPNTDEWFHLIDGFKAGYSASQATVEKIGDGRIIFNGETYVNEKSGRVMSASEFNSKSATVGQQVGEWQICPKCYGQGDIMNPYPTTSIRIQCDICNGAKIIAKPYLTSPATVEKDLMYEMLSLELPIALEGAAKKVEDPKKYLLDELRKRGYEVIKTTVATPVRGDVVECNCGSKNIHWNKVEIEVGDKNGTVADVNFKYCDDCGWRGYVDWND